MHRQPLTKLPHVGSTIELINPFNVALAVSEATLVIGPAGSGKSILTSIVEARISDGSSTPLAGGSDRADI